MLQGFPTQKIKVNVVNIDQNVVLTMHCLQLVLLKLECFLHILYQIIELEPWKKHNIKESYFTH